MTTDPQDTRPAGETTFADAEAPSAAPRPGEVGATDGAAPEPGEEATEAPAAAPVADAPGAPDVPAVEDAPPVAAGPDTETLQRERDQYLALAQRTQADFENFRRRMTRENAAALHKGVSRLATELLGALDHLELALRAAEAEGGTLYDGVRMVQQELVAGLGRAGIEVFDPRGEAFDPTRHEAMAQQPVDGAASGTVVQTYQQGYLVNGTVLRPARVVVAA